MLVPFWLIWAFAGFRGMREIWPAILVAGISFAIPQFLVSNYHGPWLVDVIAAIVSMGSLTLFLKVWQPKKIWTSTALRNRNDTSKDDIKPEPESEEKPVLANISVAKSWMPWVILSVFVFVWGTPFFKKAIDAIWSWKYAIPGLDKMVMKLSLIHI